MKTKTMKLATMMALLAAPLAFTSCSSTPEQQAETTNPVYDNSALLTETGRGAVVIDTMKSEATVDSLNASERTVTLRRSDGSLTTFECSPEVRNFDQIKVGDRVTVTLAESVAVGLIKGDEVPIGASTTSTVVRSPAGAKPGGKMVDTVGFTARVMSIDVPNRQVTLQKPDGENQTVKVDTDIDLANINPGDHVGVRVTRAFAIAVTTPEK